MDFKKILDTVVTFINTGNNLYYIIGGAVALVAIIVIAVVASKNKRNKAKAAQEVAASDDIAVSVKQPQSPPASITNSASMSADKPHPAPAPKQMPKQDDSAKVAIFTPSQAAAKPAKKEEVKPQLQAAPDPEKEESEMIEESLKRSGIIQIYKDNSERFRFRIKASNSFIVGHSQGYSTKYACKVGINAIANMVDADTVDTTKQDYKPAIGKPAFEIYRDNENKFRFRLRAANTNNILASQGYTTKDNCIRGINSIKHIILNHTLQDLTIATKDIK